MRLPFTHDQFLDVFGAYNHALWPVALLLWVATLAVGVAWLRDPSRRSPWVVWLLVAHWAWSGIAYHLVYFRPINPAATLFGALFLVQAALFAWLGRGPRRIEFTRPGGPWGGLGLFFIGYGLAYPALGLAFGLDYPRLPTFGVPCPTALLTVGFLLVADLGRSWWIAVIPLLWTVVGASAAVALGIRADLMLAAGGIALLGRLLVSFGRGRRAAE